MQHFVAFRDFANFDFQFDISSYKLDILLSFVHKRNYIYIKLIQRNIYKSKDAHTFHLISMLGTEDQIQAAAKLVQGTVLNLTTNRRS